MMPRMTQPTPQPLPPRHKICLALGSNVGDRLAHLRAALAALRPYVTVTAASPVYETLPAYVSGQPVFLNAVVAGETALDPMALLYTVRDIERDIGRQPTFHYGPRTIDIDILFFDDLIQHDTELTLPHPRLGEREFVLRPLADILPDWTHPVTGLSAHAMLAALPTHEAQPTGDALA